MALDVKINIKTAQSKGTANYGVPLIAAANITAGEDTTSEDITAVAYTECTKLSHVVDAGFSTTSDVYQAAKLLCKQKNRPKKFAVYGAATLGEDTAWINKDWRQLIVVKYAETDTDDAGNDYSTPAGIAAAIEALGESEVYKLFFTSVSMVDITTDSEDFDADAWGEYTAQFKGYDRTVIMYYDSSVIAPEAAVVGAAAGYNAGAVTYKNLILTGIDGLELTDAEIAAINGSDDTGWALTAVEKAGDVVTSEGKAASGEYVDIIDSKDWVIENISYDVQKLFNVNPKIAYITGGITQIENTVLSVLKTAFTNGMIAPVEDNADVGDYSTSFESAADVSDEDKASRYYGGGEFTFTLAGAIHEAEINGEIVV